MTARGPHYRFDNVLVDVASQQITVDGMPRTVEPKVFRLLQFLMDNRERVVRKEEIIAAIWADTFVTDNALTRAVAQIRKTLGDDPKEPRYIETVPTVGYRFLGNIENAEEQSALAPPVPLAAPAAVSRLRNRIWTVVAVAAVAAASAAAWIAIGSRADSGRVFLIANQQLTSHDGLDMNAAFSPDGHLVAFSSDRTGSFEIFVRTLEAGAPEVQLTHDGAENLLPVFSPDGQSVAYSSVKSPGIHVVSSLGGPSSRLTDIGTEPSWSPDGRSIAYVAFDKPAISVTDFYFPDDAPICIVPSAGGAARPLTNGGDALMGRFPSWGPDGRELRFITARGRPSLWTFRLSDGSLRRRFALKGTGTIGSATFSRDNRLLYFVDSHVNGNVQMRVVKLNPDTLAPEAEPETILQPTMAVPRDLSLSPDGKHLLYSSVAPHSHLKILPMKGGEPAGEPEEVTSETVYRFSLPKWSPDSGRLVFTRFAMARTPDVLISKLDGSQPVQVPIRKLGFMPRFSPDGKSILYGSNSANAPDRSSVTFEKISLGDGSVQVLANAQDPIDQFDFSPDGTRVVYHTPVGKGTQLIEQRFADGKRTQLTSGDTSYGYAHHSPDGAWLAFSVLGPAARKAVTMPSAGGPVETLIGDAGIWFPAGWAPDNDRVLVAGYTDAHWSLYWVSRTTHKLQRISKPLPLRAFVRYPEWSPDGNRIAYEYNESTGNVFLAELGLRK